MQVNALIAGLVDALEASADTLCDLVKLLTCRHEEPPGKSFT